MTPGTRVAVSGAYGEKFPHAAEHVGRTGVVVLPETKPFGGWKAYVPVLLDGDDRQGLFLPDELVIAQ